MFEQLAPQPADKIIALLQAFRTDTREGKIDLGVGVYKDAAGNTPIMRAIKKAEEQLLTEETTKAYVALAGDPEFCDAMRGLILSDAVDKSLVAAAATPGGTGAVRQAFELAQRLSPDLRVFVSEPTWPNHLSILKHLGIETRGYRYFDEDTCAVDFDGMMADLADVRPTDLVLLHGCCHNPTGANLNQVQWREIVALLQEKSATAMVDIAYQGFGDGLEKDAFGVRLVASSLKNCLVAGSCSKNFGIYRERTGILFAVSQDAEQKTLAQGMLAHLNRQSFSFPPDHGARLVTMILQNDELRQLWTEELEAMRVSMTELRQELSDALRRETGSDRFGFIAEHRGMFSRLSLTPEQVSVLREDHAIYMVGDSRINVAGLNSQSVTVLAKAIAAVLSK